MKQPSRPASNHTWPLIVVGLLLLHVAGMATAIGLAVSGPGSAALRFDTSRLDRIDPPYTTLELQRDATSKRDAAAGTEDER